MVITITKNDLKKSKNSKSADVLTIALRRYFGNSVSVSRSFIRVANKKDKWTLIPLPNDLQQFSISYPIDEWDMPYRFSIPDDSLKCLNGKRVKNEKL